MEYTGNKQFPDGETLTFQFGGEGNSFIVMTTSINDGIDREVTLTVATTEGASRRQESVTAIQTGSRELLYDSQDEIVADNNGINLKVLKN